MAFESELVRRGWQKQSILDEPRLSEMAAAYAEIGFEVHLEPFDPLFESGCSECMKASPEKYKVIYTRRKNTSYEASRGDTENYAEDEI